MPTLTVAEQLADLRDALLEIADNVAPMTPTHVRLREIAMKLDTLAKEEMPSRELGTRT